MVTTKLFATIAAVILVVSAIGVGIFVLNNNENTSQRALLGNSLEIYGNANGDWTIDEEDVKYVEKIISGELEESKFSDANGDGKIDESDIEQIRALINNNAKFVCLLDGYGGYKRVSTDPKRIAVDQIQICEFVSIMGVGDRVICGDFPASILDEFYFTQEVRSIGSNASPDYELIADLEIDMYLTFFTSGYEEKTAKLPDTDVLYLGLYVTDTLDLENSSFVQAFLKGGYIFNNTDRAESYVKWMLDIRDKIADVTTKISNEDKKTILISTYQSAYWSQDVLSLSAYLDGDTLGQAAILAGARLVTESVSTYGTGALSFTTNVEWLAVQDIDYLFLHTVRLQGNGNEVLYVPQQGYLFDNRAEFVEKQNQVAELEYAKMCGVTKDNVFLLAGDFRNNCSSGLLLSAYMCKILYPDLFKNLNPFEIHNEYMEWMGFPDYDTNINGTFIVPNY